MKYRLNQTGFLPIVLIAVFAGVVITAIAGGIVAKKVGAKYNKPLATPSNAYQTSLQAFLALKQKTLTDQQQVATLSAVSTTFPNILQLIASDKYTLANQQIASISAQLDDVINHKNEADREASVAAQLKAEADAKAAAEAAAKKAAALAAAQQAQAQQAAPAVPVSAPASGYARLTVNTDRGPFTVDVVTADLSSTRVLTDTATSGDCADSCPIFPLADYISRNGGYAGMNGSYFCPQDYSSCAGQVNSTNYFAFSYQTKTFVNADKRDYSNAGSLFVFRPGSVQFFRDPQGFGLDTSITGAIASYPTLVAGSNIVVDEGSLDDKSRTVKGNRGGLANRGNTIYLLIAHSATVGDMAHIMQAMGMDNGINLDGGGSSAMYDGGYKVGPGRNLPNAVIFAH